MQSHLWIDTPCPRVINPIISSPGRGAQHFENLIRQLSIPSTITPSLALVLLLGVISGVVTITLFCFDILF
jgi:hypothetical protein